jgi:diguanylate cyclase (GGDEF)-like protein
MYQAMVPRLSLLGKFVALSLLATVLLAVAVGSVLHERIERRALGNAEQLTRVIGELTVAPRLSRAQLARPLEPATLDALDAAIARVDSGGGGAIREVKLFTPDERIAYADDRSRIGPVRFSDNVWRALDGTVTSDVEREQDDEGDVAASPTLEVYTPVRLRPGGPVEAVLEVYTDYGPTAAAIREDSRALYLVLSFGLGALWLSLFTLVGRASRRLREQATRDPLTGLPNRTSLYDRVGRVGGSVRQFGGLAALLLIDLDRFKEVNDTLGHDQGDALLRDVSARLNSSLRRGDTLARLGGDEFAVLLHDLPNRGAAAELALRLLESLERPFAVGGVSVQLGASVGVALCPEHGTDVSTLVRRADVAMYDAKREQGRVRVYDAERDPNSPERLRRLSELRTALTEGELRLYYQPKIDVAAGAVTGVEALLRWEHPQLGLLAPDEFLPLAERTGMMGDLTRWVVDEALRQARAWQEQDVEIPIAINLAAANIFDAALPDAVAERLAHHGVPGGRLTCEISEHTVMADPRRATEVLERLRALGVRLSLDDFGTGQSSLAYLKRLPLDEVKIDRAFVSGMTGDTSDALIVRSTIDLARDLGLEVVAEGVEEEEVLERLRALRCHEAQGFHLSRPLPPAALMDWLSARLAHQVQ